MNKAFISGRITKDIELKSNSNGTEYTNFTVAIDRFVGKDKPKETDFIDCKAWGKTAAFLAQYFGKGKAVEVIGSNRKDSYKDKDGNTKSFAYINVEEVNFCLGESKSSGSAPNLKDVAEKSGVKTVGDEFMPVEEAELPF